MNDFKHLVAFGIFFGVMALVAKTKLGYTTIYYALVLFAMLLVVTQYQFIKTVLVPDGKMLPGY